MDPHFDGVIFQTYPEELARRLDRPFPPYRVLDVRPRSEWLDGHLPGALPVDPAQLAEHDGATGELIVVGIGPGDSRVRQASLALLEGGARRIVELAGGMLAWRDMGGQEERGESTGGSREAA